VEGPRAKFLTQCPSCTAPLDGRFTPLPPNAYTGHSIPPPSPYGRASQAPRPSSGGSMWLWILGIALFVGASGAFGALVLFMRASPKADAPLDGPSAPSAATRDTAPDTTGTARSGFDRSDARRQIDAATDQIQSCAVTGAPRGTNAITIVFAGTGKVSEVLFADGPLADPRVSTCIGDKYLKIKVGPFSGPPERISKSVTLR